jgi:hypothetical protein
VRLVVGLCLLTPACARNRPPVPPDKSSPPAATGQATPAANSEPVAVPLPPDRTTVFPHIHLDLARRCIEIDARVATDVHDPQTPDVYLELVACSPDSREHESLVVTNARPSHIHAALLMLGLEPGTPGRFEISGRSLIAIPPTGPALAITLRPVSASGTAEESPESWIEVLPDRTTLEPQQWVFAGSRFVSFQGQERYAADFEGTIIGLTTFGSEVIAPIAMHHHDTNYEESSFLARANRMPKFNTPVTIVITPITDKSAP